VDTTKSPPQIIGRLQGIGKKAHGLVKWHGAFVLLDSDSGALSMLRVGAGGASLRKLWQAPEPDRFLKGLTVVDDVAYFGVSEWAPRSARDDPKSNCELAAFDLLQNKLLWRREVRAAWVEPYTFMFNSFSLCLFVRAPSFAIPIPITSHHSLTQQPPTPPAFDECRRSPLQGCSTLSARPT